MMQSKTILGVFAHPDDAVFMAGASFAKWAATGARIIWLVATSGDKGSDLSGIKATDLIRKREAEERECASRLGVQDVIFLRYRDGELFPTHDLRRDITRIIRNKKPDVVVTLDPTLYWYGEHSLNHPDHRAIGEATLSAVFPLIRGPLNYPEQANLENISAHTVKEIYVARPVEPNHFEIVDDYMEQKFNAIQAHESQITDWDTVRERVLQRTKHEDGHYAESFRYINLAY
ncbi:PIG-L family deacetylase [Anaerolineales bacterium]